MDLKMGLGKIAAQVAHATLKAYKQMVASGMDNDLDFVALEEWK
jgi:peptidyl-tRNA hydrolase